MFNVVATVLFCAKNIGGGGGGGSNCKFWEKIPQVHLLIKRE